MNHKGEIRLSRTEARESWPFRRDKHAFDGCALRLDEEGFDRKRASFSLDATDGFPDRDLNLEVKLDLDVAAITKRTRVPAEDTKICVLFLNNEAKRHSVLELWPLRETPRHYRHIRRAGQYGPRGFELALVAVLDRQLDQKPRRAWRPGSLLADRRFRISRPVSSSLLNVHWSSFSEKHWHQYALWHVEYRSVEDLRDMAPEEVIEVHLNKDLPALVSLFSPAATRNPKLSPTAALLRPLVTAEILNEVAVTVLRRLAKEAQTASLEDLESGSLADQLLSVLKERAGLDASTAMEWAEEEPEMLKDKIHGLVGVGRNYDQRLLDRLLKR